MMLTAGQAEGLARIRRQRRALWWMILGYVPGAGALTGLGMLLVSSPRLELIGPLVWMVGIWVVSRRMLSARCPRCSKPFFGRNLRRVRFVPRIWYNPFACRCLHCDCR
jgi:hypothetical protein